MTSNEYQDVIIELYDLLDNVNNASNAYMDNHDAFHIAALHIIAKRYKFKYIYDQINLTNV